MAHLTRGSRAGIGSRWVRPTYFPDARWGRGRITGTVELYGTPANTFLRCMVRLYREIDGVLLQQVWSDAVTGVYVFNDVDPTGIYTAMTYDYTNDKRVVAADHICLANGTLELIP